MICSRSIVALLASLGAVLAVGAVRAQDGEYPPVVLTSRSPCYELEVQLTRRQVLTYQVATLTMRQEFVAQGVVRPPVYLVWLDDSLVKESDKPRPGAILAPDWDSYPAGTKRFTHAVVRLEEPGQHTIKVGLVQTTLPLTKTADRPECTVAVTFPVSVPLQVLSPDDDQLVAEWKHGLKAAGISEDVASTGAGPSKDYEHSFRQWYRSRMRSLRSSWHQEHPDESRTQAICDAVKQRPIEVRSSFFGYWFASVPGFRKLGSWSWHRHILRS